MSRDIIDAIDHAVADHATSADAMRWTPDRQTSLQIPPIQIIAVQQLADQIGEWLTALRRAIVPALEDIGRAVQRLEQPGVAPETPPTNPMERALWLKRNRNTGPQTRQRAPKTLRLHRRR